MTGIKDYSTTAASNTAYFPENMAPSLVNDNLRQVQADIRTWYEQAEWLNLGFTPTYVSATSFTVSGDKTAFYTVGRRIKIEDATTLYGLITASSYGAPNTTVTVSLDSGSLSASISTAQPNIIKLTAQAINLKDVTLSGTTSLTTLNVSGLATFADIKVIDSINDTNNNEVIIIGSTASAVNEITITNAATGNSPTIAATGGDTNINLNLVTKGTGGVQVNGVSLLPAGVTSYFAGNTAPSGWLECNGAAISRTTYAALFTAIGVVFGVGDGSTTFNLPQLRGEFIRGWDNGRGIDSGRAFGSAQADELKAHTHGDVPLKAADTDRGSGSSLYNIDTNGQTASTGGAETRPRNIALMTIIKI